MIEVRLTKEAYAALLEQLPPEARAMHPEKGGLMLQSPFGQMIHIMYED